MMTYTEFEMQFLVALVDAADSTERGQCEAFSVAETVLPGVDERWVRDAVNRFDQEKYFDPVIKELGPEGKILMMISGEGRKAADRVKAERAGASQPPRPKMGFT
jgi:hypothetical protein